VLQSRVVIHEIIISLFVLLTAPVVAMLIMRAAIYRDLRLGKRAEPADAAEVSQFSKKD
jgi:multicomponent K+:H+ antiporter subunit G